ncbi:hypothetical protein [Nocardia nova]|uniref:hypothetical protein n=1 Tax=Nocardia nova TaxID=37330 RepID=UPI0033D92777
MSETESTQTGRVRRRAGRPAGPPVDEADAGASASAPAAAKGGSTAQQTTGDAAATTKSAAASTADATVKLATAKSAADDATEKLATAKSASGATEKLAAAEPATEDTTEKLATAKSGGELADPASEDATVKLATEAPAEDATVKSSKDKKSSKYARYSKAARAGRYSKSARDAESAQSDDETVKLPVSSETDADASTETPGESGKKKLGVLGWAAAVVAVLSLLGLLGSGGFYFYHQHQTDSLASQRDDYVQTAKQAVLNLTNIKDDSAQQDIDRVLSVASGQLKEEYSARKDDYAKVVQQAKVKASGEIIEAALESSDDSSAKVLVAAKQTLTNAGSPDPQQRYYRFRITVTRDGGHTTASKVEFVA